MMTNEKKEQFCFFAASLFDPPDNALADYLKHDALQSLVREYVSRWGSDMQVLPVFSKGRDGKNTLSALKKEYTRLFDQWEGERISLVESTYKPWTVDKDCKMVFAASKGLIMGDWAVHMQEIYRQLSLEVPEEFRSMPDHLVLELEFLAMLYRFASNEQIERFIEDHLDWVPKLKGEMEKVDPHPFYQNAVELIYLFLQNEVNERKVEGHGQKKIH